MRISIFIALLVIGAIPSFADEAPVGVVVRGSVLGCAAWRERILDMQRIEDPASMTLIGIPNLDIRDLDADGIVRAVRIAIKQDTGRSPATLIVEFVENDADYRILLDEYRYSLDQLIRGRCPVMFRNRPQLTPPPGNEIYEMERKIRLDELSRSVA